MFPAESQLIYPGDTGDNVDNARLKGSNAGNGVELCKFACHEIVYLPT